MQKREWAPCYGPQWAAGGWPAGPEGAGPPADVTQGKPERRRGGRAESALGSGAGRGGPQIPTETPVPHARRSAADSHRESRARAASRAAAMYDPERGWSLSFSGCGFLGFYHIGATRCLSEHAPHIVRDARMLFGASAGALHGVALLSGLSLGTSGAAAWKPPGSGRGAPGGTGRGHGGPVPRQMLPLLRPLA